MVSNNTLLKRWELKRAALVSLGPPVAGMDGVGGWVEIFLNFTQSTMKTTCGGWDAPYKLEQTWNLV